MDGRIDMRLDSTAFLEGFKWLRFKWLGESMLPDEHTGRIYPYTTDLCFLDTLQHQSC